MQDPCTELLDCAHDVDVDGLGEMPTSSAMTLIVLSSATQARTSRSRALRFRHSRGCGAQFKTRRASRRTSNFDFDSIFKRLGEATSDAQAARVALLAVERLDDVESVFERLMEKR